ncbi:MAG: ribonuclease P protein component [Acidimicrobiales bacterium]
MIRGIRDRETFAELRRSAVQVRSSDLRLRFVAESTHDDLRIAYAIPRKVGPAVARNRIRRRIRGVLEECRVTEPSFPNGAALVIVHPGARDRSYQELRRQVLELLEKLEKSTEVAP